MTRVRASSNLRERAALETEGVKSRAPRGRAVAHGRGGGQAFLYVDPSTAGIAGSMLLGGLMDAMVAAQTAKAARALALTAPAKELAGGVVQILIDLEAEVHGVPRGRVHLHELAGYDTVFDAAATARALD